MGVMLESFYAVTNFSEFFTIGSNCVSGRCEARMSWDMFWSEIASTKDLGIFCFFAFPSTLGFTNSISVANQILISTCYQDFGASIVRISVSILELICVVTGLLSALNSHRVIGTGRGLGSKSLVAVGLIIKDESEGIFLIEISASDFWPWSKLEFLRDIPLFDSGGLLNKFNENRQRYDGRPVLPPHVVFHNHY